MARAYLAALGPKVRAKATAYALGLAVGTIRTDLHGAMAKLGVRTRVELVKLGATLRENSQVGD